MDDVDGTVYTFFKSLPKAELHVHIEGTLEAEMMFHLATRNNVVLPFESVEDIRERYNFVDLQSFLDIYYQACSVLKTEQDFYDLMHAYLKRACDDGVRRAEIFFDPQTHTNRGVLFDVFMNGFKRAIKDGERDLNISVGLILCFLRHLPLKDAMITWTAAQPYLGDILGVGLDSSERGFPPQLFAEVYSLAKGAGMKVVAHAGEEGPAEYIISALEILGVERIDHGIACEEDPTLVQRLANDGIPLTICPLSNVKLKVVEKLEQHGLKRLLEQGVKVTINSDDPSYFGGYIVDNYMAAFKALHLELADMIKIARNSIEASFLDLSSKQKVLQDLDEYVQQKEKIWCK